MGIYVSPTRASAATIANSMQLNLSKLKKKNIMARSRATRNAMIEKGQVKHWIQQAINPGDKRSLHKAFRSSADKKIPEKKAGKAEHSKNPLTRKRANLAET